MRRLLFGLTLILLAPGALLAQERRSYEPEDYYRVERVSNPALSPDGRHLLYSVETVQQRENDRITHIWWTDLETGRHQRLSTQGVNSTNPNWTPDGRRIYFNTSRGGESGTHFLNFTEPGGEAYRIPGISGNFTFHPSGEWVLVSRPVRGADAPPATPSTASRQPWPSGTPGMTGPTATSTRGQTEAERNNDVYVITHDVYKRDGTLPFVGPGQGGGGFGGGAPEGSYTQFFRIPANGLAPGDEAVQITSDEVSKNFQEFSRDGRWILYTVNLTQAEGEEEGEEEEGEEGENQPSEMGIFRIPSSGGAAEELYRVRSNIRGVTLSPDGRRLAFVRTDASRTDPYIHVISVPQGETVAELAKDDWIYSIGSPFWSANGQDLLWTTSYRGQDQLVKARATGGAVEFVTEGRHTFGGFDYNVAQGKIAFVRNNGEEPWEAFIGDLDGQNIRQVTSVNAEWMEQVRLSRVEYFTFNGVPHNREWLDQLPERGVEWMLANNAPDGEEFEVDAWLMYPLDYEEGRQYPLVVYIHGGPHSRYAETWFPEFQMLAAEGMFVLYTNPRGSSGYGMEFQFSTLRAWGIDDTKDVLQAVEMVVDRGLADPNRLGITGGSYGGFMTNWITAHDQRFRAAVTDRSISNWLSFYGVSDASGLVENEFGGMPWPFMSTEEGSYNLVMMLSPIVWADRVETPTLVIHSINDYRTPLEGGEQWFRALRKHDVPVKMVLFPDTSHGLSRTGEPWLLVRRLHEYRDWFKAYLVTGEPVLAENDGL